MACALRIKFEGVLYHVIKHGNVRTGIFLDDDDRQKEFRDQMTASIPLRSMRLSIFRDGPLGFLAPLSHF